MRVLVLSALLIKVHRSFFSFFFQKKKKKETLFCFFKSAILLHLSADPWSATEQLIQAKCYTALQYHRVS